MGQREIERLNFDQPPPDAWPCYKAQRDPPGFWSGYRGRLPDLASFEPRLGRGLVELRAPEIRHSSPEAARQEGRAAAWRIYEDRHALDARLRAEVCVVAEYVHADGGVPVIRRTYVVRERLAAFLARPDVLGDGDYAEASAEELLRTGVLSFEGDPPIKLEPVDLWPLPVSWFDAEAAEVVRWLDDPTAPMPEVLRG